MKHTELGNTGLNVSRVGLGCAPLGNEYGAISNDEGTRVVHQAIDAGINLFDTSAYYGRTLSETRLGAALVGKRDQVIVATKGGRYDADGFDFSYDGILRRCEESLLRLQTDYFDIYQLHDIEFGDKAQVVNEAIPALRQLKRDGKVRFIGVTGYPLALLREMCETQDLDVTLSYCHYNLLNTTLATQLAPVVKARGMGLINASITHMGMLTDAGTQSWHPAPAAVATAAARVRAYCKQRGVPTAHVATQFALQNDVVDCTLLGTRTTDELQQTLDLLETPPDQALVDEIRALVGDATDLSWTSGRPEHHESGALAWGD